MKVADRGVLDRWWVVLLIGLVVAFILLNATIFIFAGPPLPNVHDEFSNLLAADTFANGRLTNPPHPFWEHFETIHILVRPTYMSKYPPGQGLAMALGQWATGLPIVGIWLIGAAAGAATAWMLRAALPASWALAGGLLAACHPLLLSWSQRYWGGGLAMLGGTLLIGAALRLTRRGSFSAGMIGGIGMAILANSRLFEGMVLTLLCAGAVGCRCWRRAARRRGNVAETSPAARGFWRSLGGALAILAPVAIWMGYYNHRITGSAWKLPYTLHEEQYAMAPLFLWGEPRLDRQYRHDAIRSFYEDYTLKEGFYPQRGIAGFFAHAGRKLTRLAADYSLYGLLAVPLIALAARRRRRSWVTPAFIALLIFIACMLAPTWFHLHYAAPAFGLFILLVVAGLRQMTRWNVAGAAMAALIGLGVLGFLAAGIASALDEQTGPASARQRLIDSLQARGGQHLIIVRYGPDKYVHFEWVYNPADIDAAPLVFAHDMGEGRNRTLVEYFAGRSVWLLTVDQAQFSFAPYPPAPP